MIELGNEKILFTSLVRHMK